MPPKCCRLTLLPISLVLFVFSKEFVLFPAPQKAFRLLIFEALNSTSRRSAVIMARTMARVMVQPSWHGAEMMGVGGAVQWCLSFGGWVFGWVCEIGSRGSTGWCPSSHKKKALAWKLKDQTVLEMQKVLAMAISLHFSVPNPLIIIIIAVEHPAQRGGL